MYVEIISLVVGIEVVGVEVVGCRGVVVGGKTLWPYEELHCRLLTNNRQVVALDLGGIGQFLRSRITSPTGP